MGISAEIANDLSRSAEGGFGVDNPLLLRERIGESEKPLFVTEFGDRAGKHQFSAPIRLFEPADELVPKDAAEYIHRQEEGVFRMNPALLVRRKSACRNQTVDMRMKKQVVHNPGVTLAESVQLMRQGEYDVEVRDGKEFLFPSGEPALASLCLT